MDYEKKYNEALKWMRELYPGLHGATKEDAEHFFPELRESEDEKIRKWLVDYFGSIKEVVWIHRDITCEQILDWLEKQKPAEWSEEDKKIRQKLIRFISSPNIEGFMLAGDEQMFVSWLKSLRPMPKVAVADGVLWKPSEEQMSALKDAKMRMSLEGWGLCPILQSLINDLKKL